ncbi:MAG: PorV/PorQ family protein [Bacteroidia bacterium]|nr:PorV/PorQ family protein [Bacteroidia bacterium]
MRLTLIILSALIYTVGAEAQNATKYSNEFLQIGVGARSLAMGGCMTASTKDVYSGYWNPAGLVGIEDNAQVSIMHASYFAGIANYDFGAWAAKSGDNSAIGISLVRFGVDGIANTFDLIRNGEIDYTRVTSFNTTDFAAIISYAKKEDIRSLGRTDLSWGGSMKLVSRKVGPFAKAFGFGFDFGVKFENTKNNWSAGVMIRDVTSTFNSWRYTFTDAQKDVLAATSNVIPKNTLEITLPRIIGGFAKNWEKNKWNFLAESNMTITLDGKRNTLIKTNFASIDLALGGEIGYSVNDDNHIFFRTGFNNFQHYTNKNGKNVASITPNVGVGITLGRFTIDYALTNLSAVAGSGPSLYSNIFSLKLAINRDSK